MAATYLKLLLTAFFWGGTFISGRSLAGSVDPFAAAFLRFAVASVFLIGLTLRSQSGWPKIKPGQWPAVILLGMTGVFAYNVFFFKGLQLIEAGRAAVIIANNPIFIALLAALLFKESLNIWKMAGICLCVTGAVIVISRGHPGEILGGGFGRGELYIFCAVLSWVTFSLIGKKVLADISPLTASCFAAVSGAAALFFPACAEGMLQKIFDYSRMDWLNLFYLGFFGTVLGFVWYYQGIKKIGATKAAIFINFVPISAIILAFFILHEPITASLALGTLLVCIGAYLTNRRYRTPDS